MSIRSIFLILIIGLFSSLPAFAQKTDSLKLKTDTIKKMKADTVKQPSNIVSKKPSGPLKDSARLAIEAMPHKAIVRSLILPGLGQYHNKGVWYLKVPAIYAGLIAFGVAIKSNQDQYKFFLNEARYFQENGKRSSPKYPSLNSLQSLIVVKDLYRRNRDLSFLGFVGVYAINVIDAYVTAKFFRYDISEDLSLHVQPSILKQPITTNAYASPVPAIKFTLSL